MASPQKRAARIVVAKSFGGEAKPRLDGSFNTYIISPSPFACPFYQKKEPPSREKTRVRGLLGYHIPLAVCASRPFAQLPGSGSGQPSPATLTLGRTDPSFRRSPVGETLITSQQSCRSTELPGTITQMCFPINAAPPQGSRSMHVAHHPSGAQPPPLSGPVAI